MQNGVQEEVQQASWKKSRRGKHGQKRSGLKQLIWKRITKARETKYSDLGGENFQLFHDVGMNTGGGNNGVLIFDLWGSIAHCSRQITLCQHWPSRFKLVIVDHK